MGENELLGFVDLVPLLNHTGLNLGNIDAKSRVALGRAAVVEVSMEACSSRSRPQGEGQMSTSHGARRRAERPLALH